MVDIVVSMCLGMIADELLGFSFMTRSSAMSLLLVQYVFIALFAFRFLFYSIGWRW